MASIHPLFAPHQKSDTCVMQVSKESLDEFKKLYKLEFGEDLSDRDALEIAQRVLGLVMLVCRPLPNRKPRNEGNHAIEF